MPADYVACRDYYIKKGISPKIAKARCAAWFFKKHGYTVQEAHKKGLASEIEDKDIDYELVDLIMKDLSELPNNTEISEYNATTDVLAINTDSIDDFGIVELAATKVGAHAYTSDGLAVVWTKKTLEKMAHTWKFGTVSINHKQKRIVGRILDSFLDKHTVRMLVKVNDEMKEWIKKAGDLIRVSIEADDVKINDKREIIEARGTGVTFVFPPEEPACTLEEGCMIIGIDNSIKNDEKIESFVPPEFGNLPKEGQKIGEKVYNICRSKYFTEETQENKERCAKIAWEAIKKAGFVKKGDKWEKIESIIKSLTDEELDTILDNIIKEQNNINETNNNNETNPSVSNDNKDDNSVLSITPKEDVNMAEEEKEKTICAKKHEALMAEKDAIIAQRDKEVSSLKTEIESLKATIKVFEDEKKSKLLETLKTEGVDVEKYKDESIPVLEKMISVVASIKEKIKSAPEINSGAVVVPEEQKTDKSGEALTNTIEATEKKKKEEEEKINALLAKARSFYSANLE